MSDLQRDREPAERCRSTRGLFKILGNHKCLETLRELSRGEQHVTALARAIGVDEPTVSRSLACLRRYSFVRLSRTEGNWRFYSLTEHVKIARSGTRVRLTLGALDGGTAKLLAQNRAAVDVNIDMGAHRMLKRDADSPTRPNDRRP